MDRACDTGGQGLRIGPVKGGGQGLRTGPMTGVDRACDRACNRGGQGLGQGYTQVKGRLSCGVLYGQLMVIDIFALVSDSQNGVRTTPAPQ